MSFDSASCSLDIISASLAGTAFVMPALQAGMTTINDFNSTYMCQSLPFGGVKDSGFDRFAGVEGLRGMCLPKVGRAHELMTRGIAFALANFALTAESVFSVQAAGGTTTLPVLPQQDASLRYH